MIDLDRRHRLPDDAVAFSPFDRVDGAARSAVGHPDLEDDEIGDLVAYILSLKHRQ